MDKTLNRRRGSYEVKRLAQNWRIHRSVACTSQSMHTWWKRTF